MILQFQIDMGYVDYKYKRGLFDTSCDCPVDAHDLSLRLPRLSPWTWGASVALDQPTAFGAIVGNVSFTYRDDSFSTDANTGRIKDARILNATIGAELDGGISLSAYVKNALNDNTYGLELGRASCRERV